MTGSITVTQVRAIAGKLARSDMVGAIVRGWPAAVAKARITTKLRACHFLAQIMTETGGLRVLSESGAYRYEQILKTFGVGNHSAKVTAAEARYIAGLPVAQRGPVLFNRVYGVGNPTKMKEFRNTGSNDGWLYRGGGMMQCTGKSNYARREKETGLPLVAHPELLHQPDSAFTAAYLEWAQDDRCNAAADRDDVAGVRRIINGGTNGLAECRIYLVKAKKVLADYAASPTMTLLSDPAEADVTGEESADAINQTEEPVADLPAIEPVVIDPDVVGDPELFAVQKRLKGRHYSPGIPSGRWGGMTASAISGFANDAHISVGEPRSIDDFNKVRDVIKEVLAEWEAHGLYRPVTKEREAADPKTVAAVAPEVVPAKRGFWATIAGAVVTFLTAVWDTIYGWFVSAFDFLSDHKDDLPTSDSGWLSTAGEYVSKVPTGVWLALAACGLGLLAWNTHNSIKKITTAVQTGDRQ